MGQDKPTIYEIKDKAKIKVDSDSLAALFASSKFIDVVPTTLFRSMTEESAVPTDPIVDDPGDGGDEVEFPAPEISDIFIKYNGSYELPNSNEAQRRYGTLYTSSGYTDQVELEFKVMIPEELASQIVGVQILSGNEVVASA